MKKKAFLLVPVLAFFMLGTLSAQNIKRKGSFGISPQALNAELAKANHIDQSSGILVTQLFPNATYSEMGGQEKDVILALNGKKVESIPDLLAVRNTLRSGEELQARVWRAGQEITLQGKVTAMPYEESGISDVIYDEIPFKEGWLRAIVNKPKAGGKHPAIYFIPGYTCTSVENFGDIHPYRKIIDGFAELGYVVVRVEKPGMGDNVNTGDCRQLGFDNELDAYKTGYAFLKKYDFVDADNIFVFGHSMGGVHAPLVGMAYHPKGIIAYGAVHETWVEYLLKMARYQNPLFDHNPLKTDEDIRTLYAFMYEHFFLGRPAKELYREEKYKTLLDEFFTFDGEHDIIGRHEDFWREINNYNLSEAWLKSRSFVLSMYGEADVAAIDEQSHREIARLINEKYPGAATYKFIPETDHSFIKVGDRAKSAGLYQKPEYRQYLANEFNYDIISITHKWIEDKLKKANPGTGDEG